MIVLIIVAIVVVLAVALIVLYNNLVKLRNMVDNAWSQIDVQMQRRLDLIPNLVETVKGYAAHESGTLEKVTDARSAVSTASTPGEKMAADNILTGTLKSLFAVSEAYPDLKANANFQQLQSELSATEDKISYMRQSYNDTVIEVQHRHPDVSCGSLRRHVRLQGARELRCRRGCRGCPQGSVLRFRAPCEKRDAGVK